MTEYEFVVLREAVRLARQLQIHDVDTLDGKLRAAGYGQAEIDQAIATWSEYEQRKRA